MDKVDRLFLVLPLTSLALWGTQLNADEHLQHREQRAHQHGVAELNIAKENGAVHVELITPAANVVGFEHAPVNAEEEAALSAAVEKLKAGETLFSLSPNARCELSEADVQKSPLTSQHAGTQSEGHGAAHEQHEGSIIEHHADESSSHEHSPAGEADEHHEETHSELHVTYRFSCRNPAALDHIDVNLFLLFPATEQLKVQLISESAQQAFTLTPTAKRIRF